MTKPSDFLPVLASSGIEPGAQQIEMQLPTGMTVAEILRAALPCATEAELARCRVALVTSKGTAVVLPQYWSRLRPRPGVRVLIRVIPGNDGLRAVLSIVVAIAAVATGAWFAGTVLGLAQGTAAYALVAGGVALGVNVVGGMLINMLIPPVKPSKESSRNSYAITGWKNRVEPDGAVPVILGSLRYAPPFAARSWTEIAGDWQIVRALFVLGEGEVDITDIRIGETSLGNYTDVFTELRYGVEGEPPVGLYSQQVAEETIGVELVRPLPRDSLGEVIDGPAEETPVVRTCGPDASGASIILSWPGGLVRFNDEGKRRARSVQIRVEQRLAEGDEWQFVTELDVVAKRTEAFFRQHTWTFPTRGRWQVRLTRMRDESDDDQVQDRTAWAALQTLRPEYPLNYHRPLALLAMRIKATHQINGALDNITVLGSRVCLDWDSATQAWVERITTNPASLYRLVLQHPSNARPVADEEINLELLQDWHEFCTANGLTYCRVLESTGTPLREVLTEIAAAGRASPRHDGKQWGVVIDRPGGLVVDHIHPRNSFNFSLTRSYVEPPHGFIVRFQDASNDFKEAKRVVPWPGFTGEPTILETLELPGNTDATSVFREATRRALEVKYRPDVYEVTQDGAVLVATRGDTVRVTYDVLDSVHRSARVVSVSGNMIELDELIEMEEGKDYGLRFRVFAPTSAGQPPDTIGTSVVRTLLTVAGESPLVIVTGEGQMPEEGAWVLFGEAGTESFLAVVTSVEATEDMCSILRMVDAAPEIDEELATIDIPVWSGRVGAEIDENIVQPSAPRFTSVSAIYDGELTSGFGGPVQVPVDFLIEPGSGEVVTAFFVIEYRSAGGDAWSSQTIPAANGGGRTPAYDYGTVLEIRAHAVSPQGVAGPMTPTLSITVGGDPADIPEALDEAAISINTLLGGALIQFATGADANTAQVQLYRSTSETLDRETDAVGVPIPVNPLQTFSTTVGDTSRSDLIGAGAMTDPGAWTLDPGWDIAGGVASHTAGTADDLTRSIAVPSGKFCRIGFVVAGASDGTLTPALLGGSERPGAPVGADGVYSDRIQAVSGNDRIAFRADADFDGTLDDVVAYIETDACLTQGTHYLWLEPQSEAGLPGPTSGPFVIAII
ncbi:host specificity factor TipJ family phage tail protein [Salipiger marinus]|uniref:host specificity factor TipJ family phage tail protein n=1 Tax=Salipiger marinus TaxID=555512 RepID=UPI00405989E1